MTNELLRKKFKEKRKALKYTQKKLAGMVGVTDATIYTFELGQNMPTFKYIFKIAEALKMDLLIQTIGTKRVKKHLITNFSELGDVIVKRRKELKVSQARLSRIANVVSGTTYRIEQGIASPTLNTINKILYNLQMELIVEDKE